MEECRQRGEEDTVFSALSDQAFIAAVDGEADEETLEFLRNHPEYAQEVELTRQLQEELRARLYRLFCPSSDTLTKYCLRLLDNEQSKVISEHLAICPHCAVEFDMLDGVVGENKDRPDSHTPVRPDH